MKYLKEGKWEDFISEMDIKELKFEKAIEEMNSSLLLEVDECMVDLEDYSGDRSNGASMFWIPLVVNDNILIEYYYSIPISNIDSLRDIKYKIDSYIGKELNAWCVRYNINGLNSVSSGLNLGNMLNKIHLVEPNSVINILFSFYKVARR